MNEDDLLRFKEWAAGCAESTTPVQSKPMAEDKPDSNYGSYGLSLAITSLASAVRELAQATQQYRLNCRLEQIEERIKLMATVIQEFATKQKAHNEKIGKAIDGVVADVKALNDKITELQNSPGAITPEDQNLLDEIVAQSEALANKLTALDETQPPTVPDEPPAPEGRPQRR